MENAELYSKFNLLQKEATVQLLQKYASKLKWKYNGDKIIDIGCGDGSVTAYILEKILPGNNTHITGCDISNQMVSFANSVHGKDRINFILLNIENDLPIHMNKSFDHAVSFFCLQWIKNQRLAFNNVYNLMDEGGDCLLSFVKDCPIYDAYRIMSRQNKWKEWLKDAERYVSPYQDSQDATNEVQKVMEDAGFNGVEVELLHKSNELDLEVAQHVLQAINPFNIPKEIIPEYFQDFVKVVRDNKLLQFQTSDKGEPIKIIFEYNMLVAYGLKNNAFKQLYEK